MPPALTQGSSRLFLLDGMALAYRAHFAFVKNPLTTSKGLPTSAVFGFLLTLDRVLDQEKPERIAVVFDAQEPTFRHKEYPEYKATREKMPDDLVPQLGWIEKVVKALGIPFLREPGFEADDVIGTLARRESAKGHDVWIVSGDKDMTQLVGPHVKLYNLLKPREPMPELVDEAKVVEKFGVPPDRVIDVLALMGDASDNVPGVPGVGEKTAIELVQTYGAVEQVLEAAPTIPKKALSARLVEHAHLARLSKRLVTIDTAVPLHADWDHLARKDLDVPMLREAYQALEFTDRFQALPVEGAPAVAQAYHTVESAKDLDALVKLLKARKGKGGFALDTETTSVHPTRAELVGLSFSWKAGEAWYVPVNRDPPMFGGAVERNRAEGSLFDEEGPRTGDAAEVLKRLKPVLEDPSIEKTGQNAKYDVIVLACQEPVSVDVQGVAFDTMVADFDLRPDARTHNLDAMSLDRLGIKKIPTEELIGTGKNQITMREVPVEKVARYACEDADCTWRLRELLAPELVEAGVDRVFHDVDMPLLPVLAKMERTGIRVDLEVLARLSAEFEARAARLEKEIHELAGEVFNLRSNAKVGELLFEKLKLHEAAGRKKPRRTAKGTGYSTDEGTLDELKEHHPIPAKLLEWRGVTKLKNTYVDPLPEEVNPRTGRIHTTFHLTGAATGRLSSSDPNLQNIPARGDDGRAIRTAFVPEPGWKLLSADYSQIELRLLAHLAGDPGLQAAFLAGEDVHRSTAAKIFGVEPKAVTPDMRSNAKAINFGIIYGMGAQRLAAETGVTMAEAEGFIDAYFKAYPRVKAFEAETVEAARRTGYVATMLGRRRYLPDLTSEDPRLRSGAERVAVNTPIQGTAADLIKLAMVRIDRRLTKEGFRARMLLQVHDELDFEVPPDEVDRLTALVKKEMSSALEVTVPIVVDVGVGPNWAEAH
ncbi:MAG: DNA polymerase I [Planctomycetota bacterium]